MRINEDQRTAVGPTRTRGHQDLQGQEDIRTNKDERTSCRTNKDERTSGPTGTRGHQDQQGREDIRINMDERTAGLTSIRGPRPVTGPLPPSLGTSCETHVTTPH